MSDFEVLDRNLAVLLSRAYVAARPRESFRTRLEQDVLALVGRPAPRAFGLGRRVAAAAALVGLLAAGFWYAQRERVPRTLQEIVARGEVAVRRARDGAWSASESGASAPPIVFDTAFLELRTPPAEPVRVAVPAALGGAASTWSVMPDSHVALAAAAAGEAGGDAEPELRTELTAGGVLAERNGDRAGEAWTLSTREGEVQLVRGLVQVAYAAPADPSAWEPRADLERGFVHVAVRSGEARVARRGDRLALAGGREVFLSGGEALLPLEPAQGASDEQRTSVDDAQPAEPASAAAEPALISGTVVRKGDGAPLDEFRVVILPLVQLPQVGDPLVREFEDAGGRFEIASSALAAMRMRAAGYRIEVQSAGLAPYRLARAELTAGSTLALAAELPEGARIRGVVVDDVTGLPIADAWVVSEHDTPCQVLGIHADENELLAIVAGTRTGPDGGFELAHMGAGPQIVRATAPGYGPAWTDALACVDGEVLGGVELRLRAAARIQGSVLGAAGAPMPGVILLASTTDFESKRPCLTFDYALSDARGEFELRDLSGGYWAVLNLGPAHLLRPSLTPEMKFATLTSGAVARVDFHARQATRSVRGVVRDSLGQPLALRAVMFAPPDKAGPPPTGAWSSATTAADGAYEMPGLQPGPYEMCISGRTPAEVVRVGRFELPADRDLVHDVVLPRGSVSGRVLDARSGAALEFAPLVLLRRTASGEEFSGRVMSDADGRYELPFLEPGLYALFAYSPAGDLGHEVFEPLTLGADQAVRDIDFALHPGGAIEVRVRAASGEPLMGAAVEFVDRRGRPVQFCESTLTNADGRFRTAGIQPGTWRVSVSAAGFQRSEREVEIVAGERAALEVELARAVR